MDKKYEDYSHRRSKNFRYKHGDMGIDKIKLVNVASHKLKKQKLDESLMYLYHLAMYYEHRYCWRSSRDPFAYDRPCLLYTSPSPRDVEESRMPSSA